MTDWVPVVDISRHQGATNFHVMRSKGVRGLILRISHGLVLDSRAEEFYHDAVAAGFAPADIGWYPFINPKRSSGAEAALFAVEHILRISGQPDFLYMLDVENYKNESPDVGKAPVFGSQFAAHIREHIATVKALTPKSRVIGYTNRAYWNGKIYKGSVIEWVGDDELAGELDWIVARYPVYSHAGYDAKPLPPDSDGWGDWAFKVAPDGPFPPRGADWEAWQFSAGYNRQGQAYGCSSDDLDLNIVHPDAWAKWTAKSVPVPDPLPPPNPQPVPEDDDMDIRLLVLTNSDAQFLAETTSDGRALRCRWADGSAKTQAVVVAHRVAAQGKQATFDQFGNIAGLANVYLDGPLPVGDSKHAWTGSEFAGFTPPVSAVDQVARDDANRALESVTRTNTTISEIRMGGQRIADAGGH